jgi:hypothetical protein
MEQVIAKFGQQHVDWIARTEHPAAACECRAQGAWMANDSEDFAAYSALAEFHRQQAT